MKPRYMITGTLTLGTKVSAFEKWLTLYVFYVLSSNKNGVLWSQARMRIEMRLRCYLAI